MAERKAAEDKAVLDYLIKELTEQEDDNIEDLQKNLISMQIVPKLCIS